MKDLKPKFSTAIKNKHKIPCTTQPGYYEISNSKDSVIQMKKLNVYDK